MRIYVVPTWNGRWAVLLTDRAHQRFERFWKWYWPLIGQWAEKLTFGLLWRIS